MYHDGSPSGYRAFGDFHLNLVAQAHDSKPCREAPRPLLFKSAILLLLFGVAGLSTLAKISQYYPQTAPMRYVTIANKMNVAHPPALLARKPLYTIARAMLQPSVYCLTRCVEPDVPCTQRIGIVVSLQHRSPPSLLA